MALEVANEKGFYIVVLCIIVLCFYFMGAYQPVDQSDLDYKPFSPIGHNNWGNRPGWQDCNSNRPQSMQSPIDLMNSRVTVVQNLGELVMNYNPANAILKNWGHDIMLRWDGGAGSLLINGTNYQLQQCHWHSDSEHTVDSRKFALEAHLVHQTQDNKIAVIGLVYNIGAPDPFLAELMPYIKSISNRQKEVPVGVVDPRRINIGGGEYYRYLGSLTTPPCTEGVVWTINKRVRTVSTEQVSQLRIAVEDSLLSNSRPLQPLNNRDVQPYSTKSRINHTN